MRARVGLPRARALGARGAPRRQELADGAVIVELPYEGDGLARARGAQGGRRRRRARARRSPRGRAPVGRLAPGRRPRLAGREPGREIDLEPEAGQHVLRGSTPQRSVARSTTRSPRPGRIRRPGPGPGSQTDTRSGRRDLGRSSITSVRPSPACSSAFVMSSEAASLASALGSASIGSSAMARRPRHDASGVRSEAVAGVEQGEPPFARIRRSDHCRQNVGAPRSSANRLRPTAVTLR